APQSDVAPLVAGAPPAAPAAARAAENSSPPVLILGGVPSGPPRLHQAPFPIRSTTPGARRQRSTLASDPRPAPHPTPTPLTTGSPLRMKLAKTQTMIPAAEVITRPVLASPSTTARRSSPYSTKCSFICVIRKTS